MRDPRRTHLADGTDDAERIALRMVVIGVELGRGRGHVELVLAGQKWQTLDAERHDAFALRADRRAVVLHVRAEDRDAVVAIDEDAEYRIALLVRAIRETDLEGRVRVDDARRLGAAVERDLLDA